MYIYIYIYIYILCNRYYIYNIYTIYIAISTDFSSACESVSELSCSDFFFFILFYWQFCYQSNHHLSCFCCFLNCSFCNCFKCISSKLYSVIKKFVTVFTPYVFTYILTNMIFLSISKIIIKSICKIMFILFSISSGVEF